MADKKYIWPAIGKLVLGPVHNIIVDILIYMQAQ